MGRAYPVAPSANESGNQAEFVSVINGNGGLISINNFGITLSSSDPGNSLGASWPNNSIQPGDWTYGAAHTVGIDFNNGLNINGGFTVIDSGSPDQLVNEIISVGAGNNYFDSGRSGNPAFDQLSINFDAALIGSYDFTGAFSYGDQRDSATFEFVQAPDASGTWALLAGGLVGLAWLRRKL